MPPQSSCCAAAHLTQPTHTIPCSSVAAEARSTRQLLGEEPWVAQIKELKEPKLEKPKLEKPKLEKKEKLEKPKIEKP